MTESSGLVADLLTMAKACRQAATRSDDLAAEDERQRAALTLRLVADRCTDAHPETLDVARTFLDAGAKMLAAWDVLDMDEVHRSRSARRDAYAVRTAQAKHAALVYVNARHLEVIRDLGPVPGRGVAVTRAVYAKSAPLPEGFMGTLWERVASTARP